MEIKQKLYFFTVASLEPSQRMDIINYMKDSKLEFRLQESNIIVIDITPDFESYINDYNILIERM